MRGEPFEAWLARQCAIDELQRQCLPEANEVEAEYFFYNDVPPQPINSYRDDWWFYNPIRGDDLPYYYWDEGYDNDADDRAQQAALAAIELDTLRDDEETERERQSWEWDAIQFKDW